MDPFTHLLITRTVISPDPKTILAGLAADLPFYLTYTPSGWFAAAS
jgi:hypothetical protein